ncbi:hypothetical protein [Pseudoxanthomonas mexicana]
MGIFSIFGGTPPTDHIDEIVGVARAEQERIATERYHERRANDVQGGHRHLMEKRRHNDTKDELRKAQEQVAALQAKVIHLETVARKLAVDRRGLINIIRPLVDKWIPADQQAAFRADAQTWREQEATAMFANPPHLAQVLHNIYSVDERFTPQTGSKFTEQ